MSGFVPDYYAEEVRAWRWIIYPWALMEDLKSFLHQMDSPPDSVEALRGQGRRFTGESMAKAGSAAASAAGF